MSKKPETIELTAVVDVHLGLFGQHILARHLDSAEVREFRKAHDIVGNAPKTRTMCMPLWEAFQIFGPHIHSSMNWPILDIEIELPESDRERGLAEQLGEVRKLRIATGRLADERLDLLSKLAKAIGLGDTEYSSPEELGRRAHEWIHAVPRTKPNGAGQWWLDGKVVRVETTDGQGLMVVLGNSQRKSIDNFIGWGGRAVRDHRVPEPEVVGVAAGDKDEIPF